MDRKHIAIYLSIIKNIENIGYDTLLLLKIDRRRSDYLSTVYAFRWRNKPSLLTNIFSWQIRKLSEIPKCSTSWLWPWRSVIFTRKSSESSPAQKLTLYGKISGWTTGNWIFGHEMFPKSWKNVANINIFSFSIFKITHRGENIDLLDRSSHPKKSILQAMYL